jgi:hypothetical protein
LFPYPTLKSVKGSPISGQPIIAHFSPTLTGRQEFPSLVGRLQQLEKTKAQILEIKPSRKVPPCPALPNPNLTELYRQKLDRLHESLTADQQD